MRALRIAVPLFLVATIAAAVIYPPKRAAQEAEAEAEVKIPGKWFKKAKGYQEALEVQKETGADIFLYFARMVPSDQKGLCRWWEKRGLKSSPVNRLLKEYIKVQITLPSKKEDEALAGEFKVGKCPSVVIVHPDGWKRYCKVFDWPQGKPKLKDPEELVEHIRSRSSEKYQQPAE